MKLNFLIFSLFLSTIIFAESKPDNMISDKSLNNLEKYRSIITVEFKGYQISSDESIQLYGAKHRKFIDEHWYWGEAGYGALFGKRSGYLEGGVFFGKFDKGPWGTLLDFRLFTGAGGGGSAPQGGGLIVHPTIGLGANFHTGLFVMAEIGYMHFVNGDISSLSVAINMNLNQWIVRSK